MNMLQAIQLYAASVGFLALAAGIYNEGRLTGPLIIVAIGVGLPAVVRILYLIDNPSKEND